METGFFEMSMINSVVGKSLESSKELAFAAIKARPTARPENIYKANTMVRNARTTNQLLFGMSNFLLSHDGLKIVK